MGSEEVQPIQIFREGSNLSSFLQQQVDLLASKLYNLLKAGMALGYVPQARREVKVVFIPNLGVIPC